MSQLSGKNLLSRAPLGAALGTLIAVAICQIAVAAPSNDRPNKNSFAEITWEFSSDCKSVTVTSTKDISNVAITLDNDAWEKWEDEDLPVAPPYTFMIDPSGPHAGASLSAAYVKSGSYKQKDPLGVVPGYVGMGEECPFTTP